MTAMQFIDESRQTGRKTKIPAVSGAAGMSIEQRMKDADETVRRRP